MNTKNIEQIQKEKLGNRREFYKHMLKRESENFGMHEGEYANIIADFQKHLKHIYIDFAENMNNNYYDIESKV